MPFLTIILTLDVEKPAEYDGLFFKALKASAGDAIDDVQVLVLSQREHPPPCEAYVSNCPRNRAGYPVWDVFADVREVWDRVEGEYVTFSHTEFCWGPDRVQTTLEALSNGLPVLALGNLRRLSPAGKHRRIGVDVSSDVVRIINDGDEAAFRKWWDSVTTYPWAFWVGEQTPGKTYWAEDMFFARRDWLEKLRFFEHCHRMPFQDVYDVMGVAIETLKRHELEPSIYRLGRNVCELVHLSHNKTWGAYTPAMREWFTERREQWADTTFARDDLWDRMLSGINPGTVVREFRRAPGGTITNWHSEFSGWLQNGGMKCLK